MTREEARAVLLEACKDHMKRSIDIVTSDVVDNDMRQAMDRLRLGLQRSRLIFKSGCELIDQEFED